LEAAEETGESVAEHVFAVFDREFDDRVRLADHAQRIFAARDVIEFAREDFPQQDHAAIRPAELFEFALGDRTLRHPRHHVLRIEQIEVELAGAIEHRHIV